MNKKVIKNMFDEKINKDIIHERVLNQNKKKLDISRIVKISVVPICAFIVMVVSLNLKSTDNIYPNKTNTNLNIIKINNIDEINQTSYALDIGLLGDITHPSYNDLILEFPWISNFKIPYNYDFSCIKQVYENEGLNYQNYYIDYNNDNSNISIFVSELSEFRPRCIRIIPDTIEDSTINGLNVKLLKYSNDYNNGYYAFFKFNGLNFDIETSNITEEEFINLIESIINSTMEN